jgi:ketosteroid isomerase-like protein
MSQKNIETVRAGVRALSAGDHDGFAAFCSADVSLLLAGALGQPVRYEGIAGVHEFFRDMGEVWDSFGFELEEVRDLDDRVLILGTQWGRGRASGARVESRRGGVVSFHDGAMTEFRYFLDPDDALGAVGLEQ